MKFNALLVVAALIPLGGCLPRQVASHGHGIPGDCEARANGGEIFCNGRKLADVECYSNSGELRSAPECRALAIRYFDGDVAWLYVASGFDQNHPERFRPRRTQVDVDRASQVTVSLDGSNIWFFTRGVLTRGGVREYDVAAGQLRDVDRADEWRIWADVHERRAIRLGTPPTATPLP